LFPLRPALALFAATEIAAAVVATAPLTPVADAATRLFTGDYSTGDFSQWASVHNRGYVGDGAHYVPSYSATVVDDAAKGKAARFEVRTGDTPVGMPTGERSEVGQDPRIAPEGSTRWYAFSTKFDSTFPTNHASLGWGITNQFKSTDGSGNPTINFGFIGDTPDGYVSLVYVPQSAPLVHLGVYRMLDFPLDRGNWHDFKIEAHWSPSDTDGYVRVWYDGVRQTFLPGVGGGDTFTGRTMVPGDVHVAYREGYYRENGISPTGIVYHANLRIADSEDAL
jgi:hypothetical protein